MVIATPVQTLPSLLRSEVKVHAGWARAGSSTGPSRALDAQHLGLFKACSVVQQGGEPRVHYVMWVLRDFKDTSPHLSQLCPLLK